MEMYLQLQVPHLMKIVLLKHWALGSFLMTLFGPRNSYWALVINRSSNDRRQKSNDLTSREVFLLMNKHSMGDDTETNENLSKANAPLLQEWVPWKENRLMFNLLDIQPQTTCCRPVYLYSFLLLHLNLILQHIFLTVSDTYVTSVIESRLDESLCLHLLARSYNCKARINQFQWCVCCYTILHVIMLYLHSTSTDSM